jgi:hypothetical protein
VNPSPRASEERAGWGAPVPKSGAGALCSKSLSAYLRNRLVHGNDQVDFDTLRAIVAEDLPPLINSLGRVVSDNEV